MNISSKKKYRQSGYSLVEVTLALLVVAIGLTATFALFPEGLRATRAAVDDVEIAMFSEYVFTTMDLAAGLHGAGWTIEDTDDFRSGAFSPAHSSEAEIALGTGRTFYWYPRHYDLGDGNYDAAAAANFWTTAFTYDLVLISEPEEDRSWKGTHYPAWTTSAVLRVWPGEVRGRDEDARIFYREILPNR